MGSSPTLSEEIYISKCKSVARGQRIFSSGTRTGSSELSIQRRRAPAELPGASLPLPRTRVPPSPYAGLMPRKSGVSSCGSVGGGGLAAAAKLVRRMQRKSRPRRAAPHPLPKQEGMYEHSVAQVPYLLTLAVAPLINAYLLAVWCFRFPVVPRRSAGFALRPTRTVNLKDRFRSA